MMKPRPGPSSFCKQPLLGLSNDWSLFNQLEQAWIIGIWIVDTYVHPFNEIETLEIPKYYISGYSQLEGHGITLGATCPLLLKPFCYMILMSSTQYPSVMLSKTNILHHKSMKSTQVCKQPFYLPKAKNNHSVMNKQLKSARNKECSLAKYIFLPTV